MQITTSRSGLAVACAAALIGSALTDIGVFTAPARAADIALRRLDVVSDPLAADNTATRRTGLLPVHAQRTSDLKASSEPPSTVVTGVFAWPSPNGLQTHTVGVPHTTA
jgi:hypothetical protein